MKYFIIAGERSGDLHASNLIRELKVKDPKAEIRCWGGDLMEKAGGRLLQHYKEISFMGFQEVIRNLGIIQKKLTLCQYQIEEFQPDILILVDYPGFNLRIAKYAKSIGVKTCYYISPKIWAWKENRIKKIKAYVDKMLVILPFEEDFYEKRGYQVYYVGNPLVETIDSHTFDSQFLAKLNEYSGMKIAVLPGSRKQEITRVIKIIRELSVMRPEWNFMVAGVDNMEKSIYGILEDRPNVFVHFDKTYELLKTCDVSMVTSGTATLEAALLNSPQVVVYKTSWITYHAGKLLVKIKFISLVNLIAGKEVVKELIQESCNAPAVLEELNLLLNNPGKKSQVYEGYKAVRNLLGTIRSSSKAASLITENEKPMRL